MEEQKRRHHYVPRFYLSAWSNDKNKLNCFLKVKNKIVLNNVMNVGQTRDFYKFIRLTENEYSAIQKMFIDPVSDVDLKKIHMNWILYHRAIFELEDIVNILKDDHEEKKNLSKQHNILKSNLMESYYQKTENKLKIFIDKLINEDLFFYEDELDYMDFIIAICTQYFRTKNIKDRVLENLHQILLSEADYNKKYNEYGLRMEQMWFIISLILPINMGREIVLNEKYHCILLKNETQATFITGDQPIVNTKANYASEDTVEDLELYYPISPIYAVLITQTVTTEMITINEVQVDYYNNLIKDAALDQLYAQDDKILSRYL